jgi:threonine dehydrogenase-like Zn-dependent dehydrogenase
MLSAPQTHGCPLWSKDGGSQCQPKQEEDDTAKASVNGSTVESSIIAKAEQDIHVPVLIVGAGPSGLLMAYMLSCL